MAHSVQHCKKVKNDHRRDRVEYQRPHSSPFETASDLSVVEVRSKYGTSKNITTRQKDRPKTAENAEGIWPSRNLCSPDESTIKNRQSNSTLRFTAIREGVSDLLRRIRWNSNTSCSTRESQASVATTQIIPLVRGQVKKETSKIRENGEEGKRRRRSSRTRSVERKHRIFGDPKDLGTLGDRRKSSFNIKQTEIKHETASTEALVPTESEVLAIIETQRISEGEIITSARASDGGVVQSRSIQADLMQQRHLEKSVQANDGSQLQKLSKSPRVNHAAKVNSRRHHRHRTRRLSNDRNKPRRSSMVKGKTRRIKRKKCSDDEMEEFIPINNLRQSMEFSNPKLRTAAEILTEVIHNSEPQYMARRRTLIPLPPPQIGIGDRFTDPKVLPLLGSHSVTPTSQTTGSRTIFQDTVKTISDAFRGLISRNKEPPDSNGNRMWLKQVLKENRAKNKATNRTYAVTFDWGIKRRPLREGNRSLIASFLRSLRLGKHDGGKDEPDDAEQNGWYDEGSSEPRPEQFSSYFHVAPTAIIPLPLSAPSGADDLINKALELSRIPEYARAQYMTSDVDADSFDVIALSRKRRTSRSMQSHALTNILSASSKVSEKTEALLLASAGRSKGPFPMNPPKTAPKEKKSILTDDALLKIYTPKTEFTKQFAPLLPSHRGTNGF